MSNNDPPNRTPSSAPPASDPVQEALQTTRDVVDTTRGVLDATRQAAGLARGATDPAALTSALGGAAQRAQRALESVPGAREAAGAVSAVAGIARTAGDVAQTLREAPGVISGVARSVGGMGRALGGPGGSDDGGDGASLPAVRYHFTSRGAPDATWTVVYVEATEALSELYECRLDLATEDHDVDLDLMLGRDATLQIVRGEHTRSFRGIVRRVELLGFRDGYFRARVEIGPALWALGLSRISKIFQEQTAPEIVAAVFRGEAPFQRDLRPHLARNYARREYCVAYQETPLAFVQRLLAEEGIVTAFDHTGEREIWRLSDDNSAFVPLASHARGEVHVREIDAGPAAEETIRHFGVTHELGSTGTLARDFDWTRPRMALEQTAQHADVRSLEWSVYEYPAELTIGEYDTGGHVYTRDDRSPQAELRRQARAVGHRVARGESDVTGLAPGVMITLVDHPHAALNRRWLVTRVEHAGTAAGDLARHTEQNDPRATRPRYQNRFTCVPADVPFRPARPAPRPRIHGAQTATVVGNGDEIHTDHHGRIKVRFHWDLEGGAENDTGTCWVRVQQAWAGEGWGFLFIPRVGMEVVVTFLEGNPDRPLVTGCVYNGTHPTSETLDAHKTRSTIKTRSSPDSEGFNELRFEDAAGSEEIFLHAQKDLNEVVLHNHTTSVGNDQTNSVGNDQTQSVTRDQTETVGRNQSMSVTGNRTKSVTGNETTTVHKSRTETVDKDEGIRIRGSRTTLIDGSEKVMIQGPRSENVQGKETVRVNNHREMTVAQNETLTVRGNKTDHVVQTYSVTADQKFELHQAGAGMVFEGEHMIVHTPDFLQLNDGTAIIEIQKGGKICLFSPKEIELVCGDCSIVMKDGKIRIHGQTEVAIDAGSGEAKFDSQGTTITGQKITATANGVFDISGGLVRVN